METKEEILRNILSHRYITSGKCMECGKEFVKYYNKRTISISSCCCSEECTKKVISDKRKRSKERHHYEVFKDNKYYYVKEDGKYIEKRSYSGGCWILKELKHSLDNKTPLLNPKDIIPENTKKIIDKTSAYLYDELHPFKKWKNLKEVSTNSSQK